MLRFMVSNTKALSSPCVKHNGNFVTQYARLKALFETGFPEKNEQASCPENTRMDSSKNRTPFSIYETNGQVVGVPCYVRNSSTCDERGVYRAHALIPAREVGHAKNQLGSLMVKKFLNNHLSVGQVNRVLMELEHTEPSEIRDLAPLIERFGSNGSGFHRQLVRFAQMATCSCNEEYCFEPGDQEWISMINVYHCLCTINDDCVGLLVSYESDNIHVVFDEQRCVFDPAAIRDKVLDILHLYETLSGDCSTAEGKAIFDGYLRFHAFRDMLLRDEFSSLLHFLSGGDENAAAGVSSLVSFLEYKFAEFSVRFGGSSSSTVYGVNLPCAFALENYGVSKIIMTRGELCHASSRLEEKIKIERAKHTSPEKFVLLPLGVMLLLLLVYLAGYQSKLLFVMLIPSMCVCLFGVFGVVLKRASANGVFIGGPLGDITLRLLASFNTHCYDKLIDHVQKMVSSLREAQSNKLLTLLVIRGSDSRSYQFQPICSLHQNE